MSTGPLIRPTPWDAAVFGLPTWELLEYSAAAMQQAAATPGHHTIKVDPTASKRLLHDYGFYYCDTLIEPHCNAAKLRIAQQQETTISKAIHSDRALAICQGAFTHGRFHRDFNLPATAADMRYVNWLKQLLDAQQVYGLYRRGVLAGFIGHQANTLVLHAVDVRYRGKGFAKYWWGTVCDELLRLGHDEVKSSISAANTAALALYASLGFSFRNPVDVYHCLVK